MSDGHAPSAFRFALLLEGLQTEGLSKAKGVRMNRHCVLNLIGKVDLAKASPKKRAVVWLLKIWPNGHRIRFGICHCRKKAIMLTYQLPGDNGTHTERNGEQWEICGYMCAGCDFSNAGERPVTKPRTK